MRVRPNKFYCTEGVCGRLQCPHRVGPVQGSRYPGDELGRRGVGGGAFAGEAHGPKEERQEDAEGPHPCGEGQRKVSLSLSLIL